MTPSEMLSRWPTWYLVLAGFVFVIGALRCRSVWRAQAQWREAIAQAADGAAKSRLQGQRVGAFTFGLLVMIGAALLLRGDDVTRLALAAFFIIPARSRASKFALGMAEGRKSAELNVDVTSVAGRVTPGAIDWAGGALFTTIVDGIPAALLIASMQLS